MLPWSEGLGRTDADGLSFSMARMQSGTSGPGPVASAYHIAGPHAGYAQYGACAVVLRVEEAAAPAGYSYLGGSLAALSRGHSRPSAHFPGIPISFPVLVALVSGYHHGYTHALRALMASITLMVPITFASWSRPECRS